MLRNIEKKFLQKIRLDLIIIILLISGNNFILETVMEDHKLNKNLH